MRSFASIMWLLLAPLAAAQVTGRISGSVVDPTGAVIPGAAVELYLNGSGTPALTTTTTSEGLLILTAVRPETYDLVIHAGGFARYTLRRVKVDPGRETAVPPIQLQVGAVSERLEVTSTAETVQIANAEVSTAVTNEQVRRLPMLNRSPLALIRTQAGVTNNGRTNTTIHGQRVSYINVTLDGINIQDNFIRVNALDFLPNLLLLDQVAEFTISTSNAGASAGGGSAQIIFVTPSGTNRYHGSAYWSNRSNALAANTWFNNRDGIERPFLNQNQVGGALGGPIVKNKLLFYSNYEAFRLRQQSAVNRTILTADARQGVYTYRAGTAVRKVNVLQAAGVPMDPAMRQLVELVPGPEKINNYRVGDSNESLLRNTAGYSFLTRDNRTRDNVTLKADYVLSTRHVFSGSRVWNRDVDDRTDTTNDFSTVPKVKTDDTTRLLSLTWRWSPRPSLTNEARAGFNLAPALFLTSEVFPKYLLGGTLFSNPINTFRAQGRYTDTYNASDHATWVSGRHNVQFGFQMQALRTDPYNDAGITPTYTLGMGLGNPGLVSAQVPGASSTDLGTANSLLANLAGYISSYTQTFNATSRTSGFVSGATNLRRMVFNNYALYLNDAWKIAPRLSLTAGLRYDYFTVVDERDALFLLPQLVNGNPIQTLLGNSTLDFAGKAVGRPYYHPDRNNFAPNVGLAWDVSGKGRTSLRAGYSINFVNDEHVQTVRGSAGTNQGLSFTATATGLTARISTGLPAIPAPVFKVPRTFKDNHDVTSSSAFAMPDPGLRTPYVQQWSIGVQQALKGAVIEVRYVGNHATKAFRAFDYNQVVIKENGFLDDFRRALNNGNLARAAGRAFNPSYDPSLPGSQPLPVFDRLVDRGRLTNAAVSNYIQQGQAGQLASYYQTSRLNGAVSFFPNPFAIGANILSNYSNSTYNALQADITRRMRGGLQYQFNYTFSKVLSDAAGESQTNYETFLDMANPKIERSRAPFDVTHSIKANWIYDLPFGRGRRWDYQPLRRALGGWSVSGILTRQSGSPITIRCGRGTLNTLERSAAWNTADTNATKPQLDAILKVRMTGDGPYFVAASAINPADGRGVQPDGSAPFPGQVFFNPAAGDLGGLQRRMFSGPWVFNLDFAVLKTTKITERQSLEFRMESTNFLNHPTWYVGDMSINATQFGRITSTMYGRRLIQFGLYYRF